MASAHGHFKLKVLALNIGGVTQEALLWGGRNARPYKIIMPAPTVILARRIQKLTSEGKDIVLLGETMGGGPVCAAVDEHLEAALNVYATPEAAFTYSSDPKISRKAGIRIVPLDEAMSICSGNWAQGILTRDVDRDALSTVFSMYNLKLSPETIAVGVEDHGWRSGSRRGGECRFGFFEKMLPFSPADIAFEKPPLHFKRMCGVKRTLEREFPGAAHTIMDSRIASLFGAVPPSASGNILSIEIGERHITVGALRNGRLIGLLECHIDCIPTERTVSIIREFCAGKTNIPELSVGNGHGASIPGKFEPDHIFVCGSGRHRLSGSNLDIEYAYPFGDTHMVAAAGLVSAAKR